MLRGVNLKSSAFIPTPSGTMTLLLDMYICMTAKGYEPSLTQKIATQTACYKSTGWLAWFLQ
jgi:hypothetical protein